MSALIKRPRLFYEDRLITQRIHYHALFPYFDDGDVIIQLLEEETVWTLRLHRAVLEAYSQQMVLLFSGESGYQGGPEGFALHLTLAAPRVEDPIPALTMRSKEPPQTDSHVCVAYRSFFANLYGRPLLICSLDVLRAQYQAEILVYIAKRYGTLDNLRPYLVEHFTRFHIELFRHIGINPTRWLSLAIDMRYEAMYKEALVHLVGMYPKHTAWKSAEDNIRPEVLQIIRAKGQQLQHQMSLCINELFTITLTAATRENGANGIARPMTLSPQSVERWAVVHQHRDWLAVQLRNIKAYDELRGPVSSNRHAALPRPIETATPAGIGMLFRAIIGNSDDYLPWHRVQNDLLDAFDFIAIEKFAGLERDLTSLKRMAAAVITRMGLARKNLVADEEMVKRLTYLVCAEVGPDDVFWKNKNKT